LRPYQQDALDALDEARGDLNRMHVISLPTGSGKSIIAIEHICRLFDKEPEGRVLVVAPRWELLRQLLEKLRRLYRRRAELGPSCSRVLPRRVEGWARAGWYDWGRMTMVFVSGNPNDVVLDLGAAGPARRERGRGAGAPQQSGDMHEHESEAQEATTLAV